MGGVRAQLPSKDSVHSLVKLAEANRSCVVVTIAVGTEVVRKIEENHERPPATIERHVFEQGQGHGCVTLVERHQQMHGRRALAHSGSSCT